MWTSSLPRSTASGPSGAGSGWPPPPMSATESVMAAEEFVKAIDALVLSIEQQLSRLTAILNLFQFVMMALAIIGAVVMLFTGYMYVINPLGNLRQGLQQVEAGDFSTRIEVEAQDEFGQVAGGFNRMAATLQSLYGGPGGAGRGQDPAGSRPSGHAWPRCTRSAPSWPRPTPSTN
jgi:HAMP domain-containing protein